ncbi:Lysosomal thioesterase PPT2, partial [Lonchura striata]
MANAARGVHLLGYSQGGLICRALLATTPDHNVQSFISLAAPQMGQYGDTDYLKWLFPRHMKSNLYRLCYTPLGQGVSICNYWNDPHHRELYLNSSDFLALLNDERLHPNASDWKRNLLRIQRLVLIGGPDDGVITPWQSRWDPKNPQNRPEISPNLPQNPSRTRPETSLKFPRESSPKTENHPRIPLKI